MLLLFFASAGAAPPTPTPVAPPSVGSGTTRRFPRNYWTIRGKTYLLEDEDVPALVQAILAKDAKQAKALKPAARKVAKAVRQAVRLEKLIDPPTFPAMPAFDLLWKDLMAASQHREAEMLRQIVHEMAIEQDDVEIFQLIQMIEDQ